MVESDEDAVVDFFAIRGQVSTFDLLTFDAFDLLDVDGFAADLLTFGLLDGFDFNLLDGFELLAACSDGGPGANVRCWDGDGVVAVRRGASQRDGHARSLGSALRKRSHGRRRR